MSKQRLSPKNRTKNVKRLDSKQEITVENLNRRLEKSYTMPSNLQKVNKLIKKEFDKLDNDPDSKISDELLINYMNTQEHEFLCNMVVSVDKDMRTLAVSTYKRILRSIPKALRSPEIINLIEMLAIVFCNYLSWTKRLANIRSQESINRLTLDYMDNLGKNADRAFRQYSNGLLKLKLLTQPSVKVSVKANNAIVGNTTINN